ncbi:MAG: ribonuclease III domain-containing protein [Candidatus Heimdallarchaeaceae archaeon]|jgi:ribonuclease-3
MYEEDWFSNETDDFQEILLERFKKIETILGYDFKNKWFLLRAITTKGFVNENYMMADWHQEAYATLGDGVLDLIVLEKLVRDGLQTKGEISNQKQQYVNNHKLHTICVDSGIGEHLFWPKSQLLYGQWKSSYNILATSLEAIIGAIYLDSNITEVKRILTELEILN